MINEIGKKERKKEMRTKERNENERKKERKTIAKQNNSYLFSLYIHRHKKQLNKSNYKPGKVVYGQHCRALISVADKRKATRFASLFVAHQIHIDHSSVTKNKQTNKQTKRRSKNNAQHLWVSNEHSSPFLPLHKQTNKQQNQVAIQNIKKKHTQIK